MRFTAVFFLLCSAWAAIVGIDLGHQYTKAMMVAPGLAFEIVLTDEGKRKDLSAISLRPVLKDGGLHDAERVFGSQIGSLCTRFPDSCAANIKALLGQGHDGAAAKEYLRRHHGVTLVEDADRDAIRLDLGPVGKSVEFSVEELTAMSLNELKDRVLKVLAHHPQAKPIAEDVAVSIPPFASQLVRNAYFDTLHLSNYSSVLGLVDEGTAVALGYVFNKNFAPEEYDGKTVYHVVYDVGAGSTSATLFSYTPLENLTIVVDIESIGHDDSFGGELLTQSVYELLFSKFVQQFGLKDSTVLPPKLASRLLEAAEKAKIILSANTDYKVTLESFYKEKDLKAVISRDEFEEYTLEYALRTTKPILDALANSPLGPKTVGDIQLVILTGGSTRVPLVQKHLLTLLGSEEKIAKVVNADEACAYGTTVRGYQLKLTGSNPSNIELIDRVYSNFEISVGDSDAQTMVFAKGTAASTSAEIPLGAVEDNLEVGMYENGELFSTYRFENLTEKSQAMKCASETREFVGTFEIDVNKVFSMSLLTIKCVDGEEAPKESESNSTASNSTSKKTKPRPALIPVSGANFATLRPLNSTEKKKSSRRLTQLKTKDLEKIAFDETKNLLEAACYELRSFIDENFANLAAQMTETSLEELQSTASDTVEWLEFESDDATVDEIKAKYENILSHKKSVDDIMKLLKSDLSIESLQRLYQEGSEISLQVQEFLLEFGKLINRIRQAYESDGLDFDKENERVIKLMQGEGVGIGFELDSHYSSFKTSLKALASFIELSKKEFKKVDKKEVFATYNEVTGMIITMSNDVLQIQAPHEKRVGYLLDKHQKLLERKQQKAFRQKLKEEKEAAEKVAVEKDAEVLEEPVEDEGYFATDIPTNVTDSQTEQEISESSEQSSETETNVHDEL